MELSATFKCQGKTITIVSDDPVIHAEHAKGLFDEHFMLHWIQANIPHGGTWVDVGANIGNHSVFFALFCADKVVSIEPALENQLLLARNMKENVGYDYSIEGAGAGDRAGVMGYDPPKEGKRWSQVQLAEHGQYPVPIITIDSLELQDVRLLKIDVEGMEPQVLLGAIETIKRDRPEIFVEIWSQRVLDDITQDLGLLGYTLIECYGEAPTFFFSASGRHAVTYKTRHLNP